MKDFWFLTMVALTFGFIGYAGYKMGYTSGYSSGIEWQRENRQKVECEVDYSYKPYSEIPGKCLKYFKEAK